MNWEEGKEAVISHEEEEEEEEEKMEEEEVKQLLTSPKALPTLSPTGTHAETSHIQEPVPPCTVRQKDKVRTGGSICNQLTD